MRKILIFNVFICFLAVFFSVEGQAVERFGKFIWGPPKSDFVRPYLEEAKLPHNSQWADDEWSPQDWIDARGGSVIAVVNGFYSAGIIKDQYFDDDVPVLEVGQTFIDLSGQEQRRVVAFMDDVFGVTSSSKAGVIEIEFHDDNKSVGLFTKDGLQLQ